MKRMYFFAMLIALVVYSFTSCSNNEEAPCETLIETVMESDEFIERDVMTLTSGDAMKVAKLFSKGEVKNGSRVSSTRIIKDIQTVSSETGEPLMYIINYTNNHGYTVVGATKNYAPILVHSETGNVNMEDESFLQNPFFTVYKTSISSVINQECDSLRQRYALNWSAYEKEPDIINARLYTDQEIQQKLSDARTYYGNLGYECHSLGAASYLIPASNGQTAEQRANGFVADICAHTTPGYDCMSVTLLLVKRGEYPFGRYTATDWGQNSPYNVSAPNGLAGCATIAVTQLMKYYEWPSSFDWANIRDSWSYPLYNAESYFMDTVRDRMYPTYNEGSTSIERSNMVSALTYFNYNVSRSNYNRNSVINFIKRGNPIIMIGTDTNGQGAHAWICDGYKTSEVQYAAYMIDRDFDDYMFFSGMKDIIAEYFHMNLGWNGYCTGWYYYDSVSFNNFNYENEREVITAIPNR